MRIRVLQHVPHEGPGAIAEWATARGHEFAITRLDQGEAMPEVGDFDVLVSMGGPMSANDDAIHPWLAAEKHLVVAAAQENRRILGICLGSQIVASALGRKVGPSPRPEIGWFPVRVRPEASRSRAFAGMERTFTPFHWHGEMFELPEGAIHLAETDACPNQAFEIEFDGGPARGGALVLAMQFHVEATESGVRAMCDAEKASLARAPAEAGGGIAPTAATLLGDSSRFAAIRPLLEEILDRLTAPAAAFRDTFGAGTPRVPGD